MYLAINDHGIDHVAKIIHRGEVDKLNHAGRFVDLRSERDLVRGFSGDIRQESQVNTLSFGTLTKRFTDSTLTLEGASFDGIPDSVLHELARQQQHFHPGISGRVAVTEQGAGHFGWRGGTRRLRDHGHHRRSGSRGSETLRTSRRDGNGSVRPFHYGVDHEQEAG